MLGLKLSLEFSEEKQDKPVVAISEQQLANVKSIGYVRGTMFNASMHNVISRIEPEIPKVSRTIPP